MKKYSLMAFLWLCALPLLLAQTQPPATPADNRIESMQTRQQGKHYDIINGVEFKSVGPSVFSGRVVDIAVSPKDPSHFYVAYASGGLWKTTNNGISFTPIFDHELVMTIGAIAVDWENGTIWVGTGEVNSSRSSYAGIGMYKSDDDGKSWQHMGLDETHHIGKVIIHPTNPNVVWVSALGHLYSPNEERGVYKTSDGGNTWQKTLYVNENTGSAEMVIDPGNPDILYASMWYRERRAWNFVESGSGSGIYKSTDGGNNWTLITKPGQNFPTGEGAGRIGLAIYENDGETVLFASIDNYFRKDKEEEDPDVLTKDFLRNMSAEDFLALEKYQIQDYLNQYRFPRQYKADQVIKMVKNGEIKPNELVKYVEDANSLLFDTPVIGLQVYASTDEGKTWEKRNTKDLDGVYNSYGYYFGQIRVAPYDKNKVYCLGVPVIRSDDGGKTFKNINGDNVHSDHHSLWINPNRPGHLILGNDGGINISYDDGESWIKCNTPPVGQFYYIAVDDSKPYNIYGGLQDNGTWVGPKTYSANTRWHGSGRYPYERVGGGDGMQVAIDTRNNEIVFAGYQFGNYFRLNKRTNQRKFITPKHDLGEAPFRWNWQAPIHLSKHNQDIFYMGSNFLHRSFNQGDDFEKISPDLTAGGRKGDVAFGTLTTIHESPLKFGLLYTGSDDGLVHVSKDGGNSWTKINDGLPENMWVSRIIASQYDKATVYVALNGYRWDDFNAYLYKSTDYGATWEAIGKDLPMEPLNVIKEDPVNPDMLYVGSDHGLYVSLDGGQNFNLMDNGLPAVAVHDVVVHPRDRDIVVGTHGRSLYLAPGTELQQLTTEVMAKAIHLFEIPNVRFSSYWGRQRYSWVEANEPETTIPVFVKNEGPLSITIKHGDLVLKSFSTEKVKGLQYLTYDLSYDSNQMKALEEALNEKLKKGAKPIKLEKADNGKVYLQPGTYEVLIKKGSEEVKGELKVTSR